MRKLIPIWLVLCSALFVWAEPQCGAGYAHYRTITIDHTLVPNTDQTDFPVVISGTFAYLAVAGSGGDIQHTTTNYLGRTTPADIQFCVASRPNYPLSFEVVNYTTTSGLIELWVKVPTVATATDTVVYMFYGNTNITTSTWQSCDTWSNSFVAVLHMPDGSSLDAKDSSCSANDGTINSATATTGKIDGGGSFANSPTITRATFGNQPLGKSNRTIWTWSKATAFTNSPGVIVAFGVDGSGTTDGLYVNTSGKLIQEFGSSAGAVTGATTLTTGTFFALSATYDGTSNKVFINGVQDATGSYTTAGTTQGTYAIGSWVNGCCKWNGLIDEVEISSTNRSADWQKTAYNNQNNPAGFYTISAASTPTASCTTGYQAQAVTIDHTKAGSADTTNFPFVISGTYNCLARTTYGGSVASASGYDIGLFSDITCTTRLDSELVSWDGISGYIEMWGRIPTLSHTVDTVVYLCYGSSSITTDQSNKSGIWGSHGYVGVFHGGTPTSVNCNDSGSAAHDLTVGGSMLAGVGIVGGAMVVPPGSVTADTCGLSVTGTDKISNWGYPIGSATWHYTAWAKISAGALGQCNDCSFGGWGKTNTSGAAQWMWENRPAVPNSQYGFTPGALETGSPGVAATTAAGSTPSFPVNGNYSWHRVDIDCTGTTIAGCSIYIDAVVVTGPVTTSGSTTRDISDFDGNSGTPSEVRIGRAVAHGAYWYAGSLDEMRFSTNSGMSVSQMLSEYNNESSPLTFYTLGASTPVATNSRRRMSQVY